MFKFLKDKLKSAVSKFSKGVDDKAEEIEPTEKPKPKEKPKEKPKKKAIEKQEKKPAEKPKSKKKVEKPKVTKEKEEPKVEPEETKKEEPIEAPVAEGPVEDPSEEPKEEPEEEPEPEKEHQLEEPEKEPEPEPEEPEDKPEPEEKPEPKKKKSFIGRLFGKKEEELVEEPSEEPKEEPEEEPAEQVEEVLVEEEPEKKSIFDRVKETVTKKALSESEFEELFWELEVVLLENNMAVEVIEKIKNDLREQLVDSKVLRGKVSDIIEETLRNSIKELFDVGDVNVLELAKEKKPFVILFIGVNGSGKTTTIAKFANLMKKNDLKPVIAAADTFRAAAIQQLEEHGEKLGVKVIKHDYGSDPAAVGFDTIKYADSKGLDVVLIDSAGRQSSNVNLMDEMKKIVRVCNPDLKIFVGESITGNDCIEQAQKFNDAVDFDAIILSKLDVDEKGGAAVSVSYVTKKPVIYFGNGQEYGDLVEFDSDTVLKNVGLD